MVKTTITTKLKIGKARVKKVKEKIDNKG